MAEQTGIIKEVAEKQGNKGPYHSVTIDTWHYNLFQQHAAALVTARENLGARAKVTYTENGKFRDFESLEILSQPTGLDSGGAKDSVPPDVWAEKDRRICRVAIAKSIIEATGQLFAGKGIPLTIDPGVREYADFWCDWVYEQVPTQQSAQSVEGPDPFDDAWIEEANWTPESVQAELVKVLMGKRTGLGWAGQYTKNMLTEKFGYGSVDEMPQEMLEEVVTWARQQKAT